MRQHKDAVLKQLSLRETMDGDCVLWLGQAITRSLDTHERRIPTQLPDYSLCLSELLASQFVLRSIAISNFCKNMIVHNQCAFGNAIFSRINDIVS